MDLAGPLLRFGCVPLDRRSERLVLFHHGNSMVRAHDVREIGHVHHFGGIDGAKGQQAVIEFHLQEGDHSRGLCLVLRGGQRRANRHMDQD